MDEQIVMRKKRVWEMKQGKSDAQHHTMVIAFVGVPNFIKPIIIFEYFSGRQTTPNSRQISL